MWKKTRHWFFFSKSGKVSVTSLEYSVISRSIQNASDNPSIHILRTRLSAVGSRASAPLHRMSFHFLSDRRLLCTPSNPVSIFFSQSNGPTLLSLLTHHVFSSWPTMFSPLDPLRFFLLTHYVFSSWPTMFSPLDPLCFLLLIHYVFCSWFTMFSPLDPLCFLLLTRYVFSSWPTMFSPLALLFPFVVSPCL